MAEESRIKLDPDQIKILQGLEGRIREAKRALDAWDKMGIDTGPARQELDLSITRRNFLLEHFS
jgi:hypothetical protein